MRSTNDVASSMIEEEGTITPPFDMTVLNELDRFHEIRDWKWRS